MQNWRIRKGLGATYVTFVFKRYKLFSFSNDASFIFAISLFSVAYFDNGKFAYSYLSDQIRAFITLARFTSRSLCNLCYIQMRELPIFYFWLMLIQIWCVNPSCECGFVHHRLIYLSSTLTSYSFHSRGQLYLYKW